MAKEKSENGFGETFKLLGDAVNQSSAIGELYGRMFALQEIENYIIAEKIKVKKQLNEGDKRVPMTEEQEYANAGISKEEAEKNGLYQKIHDDTINHYDRGHNLSGYANTLTLPPPAKSRQFKT